jgi:hypothetical protein
MSLSDSLEKLGRAIFERPFNSARLTEEAPELAEIRLAVLDAVKAAAHRAGSIRVFPFEVVSILLRGIPEQQAAAFESGVLAEFLSEDLGAALVRSSIRFPNPLEIHLRTTPDLPLPGEQWIVVSAEKEPPAEREPAAVRTPAWLIVLAGLANTAELELTKARINIGRSVDVYRSEGPSRKNDLAFVEDNEINRTVSREHAHLRVHKASGEHRLFNDRFYKTPAQCGLWILRDGLSQPVHRGDRGVALKSGDEIHFGRAVVKFIHE